MNFEDRTTFLRTIDDVDMMKYRDEFLHVSVLSSQYGRGYFIRQGSEFKHSVKAVFVI